MLILSVAGALGGCAPAFDPRPAPLAAGGAADRSVGNQPDGCYPTAAEDRVAYASRHAARLQALRARVRARRAAGDATAVDVAQVEARLAGARARLARAKADLAHARAALAEATGGSTACPPPR